MSDVEDAAASHDDLLERLLTAASHVTTDLRGREITAVQSDETAVLHALVLSAARQALAIGRLVESGLGWEAGALARAMLETSYIAQWLVGTETSLGSSYLRVRMWMLSDLEEVAQKGDLFGRLDAAKADELDKRTGWLQGEIEQEILDMRQHLAAVKADLEERKRELADEIKSTSGAQQDALIKRRKAAAGDLTLLKKEITNVGKGVPGPFKPNAIDAAGHQGLLSYRTDYSLGSKHVHPSMHTVMQVLTPQDGGGWTVVDPPYEVAFQIVRRAADALAAVLETVVTYEEERAGEGPLVAIERERSLIEMLADAPTFETED